VLDDEREVSTELVKSLAGEELAKIENIVGPRAWSSGHYQDAARIFLEMCTGAYVDFLTLPAYQRILDDERIVDSARPSDRAVLRTATP
jgi:malate synthase